MAVDFVALSGPGRTAKCSAGGVARCPSRFIGLFSRTGEAEVLASESEHPGDLSPACAARPGKKIACIMTAHCVLTPPIRVRGRASIYT